MFKSTNKASSAHLYTSATYYNVCDKSNGSLPEFLSALEVDWPPRKLEVDRANRLQGYFTDQNPVLKLYTA
jgi:hypothetical protein